MMAVVSLKDIYMWIDTNISGTAAVLPGHAGASIKAYVLENPHRTR